MLALTDHTDAFDQIPISGLPLGRPPRIMFHAGDVSLDRAVSLGREAKGHGADEILVVAPCIMRPATQEMLIKVIGMVAAAADLPTYYYYYPALYNVDFPMVRLCMLRRYADTAVVGDGDITPRMQDTI